MAAFIEPKPGEALLAPDEVVKRLKNTFVTARADKARGRAVAADTLARLIQLKAPAAKIQRMTDGADAAVYMSVSDARHPDKDLDAAVVGFNVIPGEPLFTDEDAHEDPTKTLIARVARVLGYVVRGL